MLDAPRQDAWVSNRKSFRPTDGIQEHFVASSDDRIVGYAAIERHNSAPAGLYRMYLVVEPPSREILGTMLFGELRKRLIAVGALRAWMMEYAADADFIAYLERLGFERTKTVAIDGRIAIEMKIAAPFDSLAGIQAE